MEDAASIGTSMSASVESYAPDFSPAATELLDAPLERTVDAVAFAEEEGTEAGSCDETAERRSDEGAEARVVASGLSARRRSRRRGKVAPAEADHAVTASARANDMTEIVAESIVATCTADACVCEEQIAPKIENTDADADADADTDAGVHTSAADVTASGVAASDVTAAVDAAQHGEPLPERIIEAILFASDSPVMPARLADVAGLENSAAAVECVEKLNAQYAAIGLAFRIEKIARGYQMMTIASYQPYLARLHQQAGESRLSDAALETLSIIAYKQPMIRADVEAIRGVAAGDGINRLRAMGLVKIVGRAEIVGRPILYGTTKKFLDMFGLADLNDLPPLEALRVRPATKPASTPIETVSEAPRVDAMVA
ncbi:MAG: SMC-Scp complex subunit ScpB [Phycisphaerae bacterium]